MTEKTIKAYQDLADKHWFIRLLEITPGFITWAFIMMPVILSRFEPVWVAYFIIGFDLIWLAKSFRLSYYLVRGYTKLRRDQKIDWQKRLAQLGNPGGAIASLQRELKELSSEPVAGHWWGYFSRKGWRWIVKHRGLVASIRELEDLAYHKNVILDPKDIINVVIIATYNESLEILEPSLESLLTVNYPLSQLMVVFAYEERGGAATESNVNYLVEKYGSKFAMTMAVKHPVDIPGEAIGKGANISFAARKLTAELEKRKIAPENVIITTFDSDHRPDEQYFAYLSYVYAINPNRTHKSYQPVPMFYNNIWDVPAPMRVIATGNSFWVIMEAMRPHRLRNFAAHAQSLKTLIDTDYWSITSIVEDGHQYWRTYFTYNGDHQVVPLFIPVYQDAVLADGYIKTFKVQYLQLRRWAWGISDFPYVVRQSMKNRQIALGDKLIHIWRLFEGHFSWATAPLILTFVAWLPLYLNPRFADMLLAHQLPIIASRILNLAMLGLSITVIISLISLPPRPKRYGRGKIIEVVAQWLLLPIIAIVFSAFTAIDSQTRLMLGKYLDFRVTDKARKQ